MCSTNSTCSRFQTWNPLWTRKEADLEIPCVNLAISSHICHKNETSILQFLHRCPKKKNQDRLSFTRTMLQPAHCTLVMDDVDLNFSHTCHDTSNYIFIKMKKFLSGDHFDSDDIDVISAVDVFLKTILFKAKAPSKLDIQIKRRLLYSHECINHTFYGSHSSHLISSFVCIIIDDTVKTLKYVDFLCFF